MRVKLLPLGLALGAAFLLLSGFRPGTLPYTPGGAFSDAVTSHLPAAQFLRASLLDDGVFPLWRETILAGQPFAANPLNKTAYPLQWLVLLLPPVLHLDLLIVLHLLIAGTGMWTWERALGLRAEAAAVSALAYALAPRVVGHTGAGHLDLLYALAWFPWLMWAVGAVMHGENESGAGRVRFRRLLAAGLFAGLLLLADVRLSLFAYALAGGSALTAAVHLRRTRRLLAAASGFLLAVPLAASVIVPLLAWSPYLSRAALTPQDAGVFSLDWAPLLFGLILPVQGGNIETLTYVGLPVLALAILGAVTARRWFWTAAAGVAALYALGAHGFLWPALTRIIPALLWLRVPARAWFVVALIAPLLAGYGAQWLLDLPARRKARRGAALALIAAAAFGTAGVFLCLTVPTVNGLAVLVGGSGIGLVGWLALTGRLHTERLALALLLVTFLDLTLAGRGWLEWRAPTAWLTPPQVALAERLSELGAYRIYSPTYSLQQPVAEDYHLRLFGGVDPFQVSGVVAAIRQGGGVADGGYSVVEPPLPAADLTTANRDAVPDTAVLGAWGVTHVVSAYPLAVPLLEPVAVIDGVYVYANRDPALTTDLGALPAWPDGWPGLPDRATVAALNRLTATAAIVSGAAFVALLALLGVMKVRH